MAQFELTIYDENDDVVKKHETDRVRWGVFLQALELEQSLRSATPQDMISAVNEFVKKIFPALTDEELANADVDDVLNTFKQLISKAGKIGGSTKNAAGAE